MVFARLTKVVILSLMTFGLTGCFSSNPENIQVFSMPYMVDTTSDSYILQPPDEVIVYCSKVPEIHGQQQQIRPDGKISFEGVGEIEAAGKSPKQLVADLRMKILDRYKADLVGEKAIDVRILGYQSKVYYVMGQVYEPGPRLYTGRDTVLTALAIARPNPVAWKERIQIIRPSYDENVEPKVFELNFDRMIAHGDTTMNVLLQEGDIIYVPPTILGWMALRIEEVIRPIARAFSGIYTVRRGLDDERRYY
jgi:protein involved in polysaccharide export with SLBB domain